MPHRTNRRLHRPSHRTSHRLSHRTSRRINRLSLANSPSIKRTHDLARPETSRDLSDQLREAYSGSRMADNDGSREAKEQQTKIQSNEERAGNPCQMPASILIGHRKSGGRPSRVQVAGWSCRDTLSTALLCPSVNCTAPRVRTIHRRIPARQQSAPHTAHVLPKRTRRRSRPVSP